jgi:signal transduction histidine kinase/ActR/RegA family two-component response regulator
LRTPPGAQTDLRLFNKPVQPGAHSLLQKPIWATDSLTLTHNQGIFTIEFAALSYAVPEKNRYRYRLEGLESEWNEVDYRQRLATYSSLPPGKYVFRVQASNNDGLWNQTGAALAIQILPPWWATWWFRSLAGLSLMTLTFAVYRSRVRHLRLEALRLELQVSQRTRELEERTRQLQIAKDAAETASCAKSAFLATVSHELRSPLNTILLLSHPEWTGAQNPDDSAQDLNVIRQSAENLLHLVDDVLDSARIEAGQVAVENAMLDLHELIQEVSDLLRMRAEQKSLDFLLEESARLPRFILTDGAKLRHVLINLLDNAIKYTDQGRVMLRVDSHGEGSTRRRLLTFEIADTGVGIALQDQPRIFEPFTRVTNASSSRGTGLGLSIVRQYVDMMRGSIRLESALGEGSRFFVDVPVDLAESEKIPAKTNTLRVEGLAPGQPAPRVLIIEDRPEDRSILRRILEQAGFRVQVAETGESGIEMFKVWRPHFIWMDRRLPGMDGLKATRCIRAMDGGSDVKIAGLSASVFVSERHEMLAAGLDDFVRKPYLPKEIFDCIARHLDVCYTYAESAVKPPAPAGKFAKRAAEL